MASKKNSKCTKKEYNKGPWTAEEDQKLGQAIEIYGAKRWKSIASKAALNRCEKSCRLRWLNYLRPNIKRGNISDQEEDLILRLHKLLGNRWSLIAGRLPGRTDNEIKNYWNSYLSKKIIKKERERVISETTQRSRTGQEKEALEMDKSNEQKIWEEGTSKTYEDSKASLSEDVLDELLDCSDQEGTLNLEWLSKFLELD